MKRATSVILIVLFLLIGMQAQALSWAYEFVTWDGKIYEVKKDQKLDESQVGEVIGEVERVADDMTGEYYGDASNYYEAGTKYYEITGTPKDVAIAVLVGNNWVQANFVGEQPPSLKATLTSPWLFVGIGVLVGAFIWFIAWGIRKSEHV